MTGSENYGDARVTDHQEALDRIAKALLERESLESDELDLLIAGPPCRDPQIPAAAPVTSEKLKPSPRPEELLPAALRARDRACRI